MVLTATGKRARRNGFNLGVTRDIPLPFHLAPKTPASAIADRIFNDPESWNAERLGVPKEGSIPAFDLGQEVPSSSDPNSADFTLKPFTHKFRLAPRPERTLNMQSPESDLEPSVTERRTQYTWEGVKDKPDTPGVPFITLNFEGAAKDTITPSDRMSILWTHTNLFHAFPTPLALGCASPPSPAPGTDTPVARPSSAIYPSPPRFSLLTPNIASPRGKPSTSTTWSILEYYGVILPETPRTPDSTSFKRSSGRLRVPAQPSAPPPLPPVPARASTLSDATARVDASPESSAPSSPSTPTPTPANPIPHVQARTLPITPARSSSLRRRPLPDIPTPPPVPPVPTLEPPSSWTRRRANTAGDNVGAGSAASASTSRTRANTTGTAGMTSTTTSSSGNRTSTNLRSLPPPPPPPRRRGHSHAHALVIPPPPVEPAPAPVPKRHRHRGHSSSLPSPSPSPSPVLPMQLPPAEPVVRRRGHSHSPSRRSLAIPPPPAAPAPIPSSRRAQTHSLSPLPSPSPTRRSLVIPPAPAVPAPAPNAPRRRGHSHSPMPSPSMALPPLPGAPISRARHHPFARSLS
ncbi:hypothetical protein C8R47DRAFT_1146187 [Mycena vitilis]|nr:hypothetical protein C8R47DRAFT_1146187 [Mycena vitilis]